MSRLPFPSIFISNVSSPPWSFTKNSSSPTNSPVTRTNALCGYSDAKSAKPSSSCTSYCSFFISTLMLRLSIFHDADIVEATWLFPAACRSPGCCRRRGILVSLLVDLVSVYALPATTHFAWSGCGEGLHRRAGGGGSLGSCCTLLVKRWVGNIDCRSSKDFA